MRKPRHLSAEERALWDRVAERATPLHPNREEPAPDALPISKAKKPIMPRDPLPDFRVGQKTSAARRHDVMRPLVDRLAAAPVNMDNKSFGKMKRGKLKPEARIDLHGMTMAEAHPELASFIMRSQSMGRRLVLVITGKGKDRDDGGPIPTRHGILRHQVPQWLALPPLSPFILQVTPAHLKHGGHGAYYVYLRRNR
ncbi:DNA-nicking Smr family endonuclease [Yoonia maricola]|uniref:DNA-nicking Smr family endonuclease n=1 Tax=Yoonia maricola TaxID=420999 RepID=A0A2M8W4N5_9RHOB|nr:Smr/MutS family protein [Yoonia maricola]PJI85879.1 DNA-nicking Smr family endonuclease [Yoonia maricola]